MKKTMLAVAATVVVGFFAWGLRGDALGQVPAGDDFNQILAGYGQAFNKQDAAALGQYWAPDAEYVSDAGVTTKSREGIVELFRQLWKNHPGTSLKLKTSSFKLLKPDVALHDGVSEIKSIDGVVESSPFSAVWVKSDGRWQLSRVRDLPTTSSTEENTPKGLRDLEWLVGDWGHEEGPVKVALSVKWYKNRSFLVFDQTVTVNGEEALVMSKFIGWDPIEEQIRSWMFDSKAGFGGGVWARDGNTWVVDVSGVMADGRAGTATNTWKYISDDRFEWLSTNREVDGRPSADIRVQYVRKGGKR